MFAAHRVLSCFSISESRLKHRAICDGNARNGTVSRGIVAVRVHAAADNAAGDASCANLRDRRPSGGFQKMSTAFPGLRAHNLGSHLVVHGQPREMRALEARYARIEQLFFLAAYFFFPAELMVTGIDSLGAAGSPIPGNPRRVGVRARSSGHRSSRPTRWARLHHTVMSLMATIGSDEPSVQWCRLRAGRSLMSKKSAM